MKLAVIGTGYVGLVAGACFAEFGHTVTCVDVDERRVRALLGGAVPLYEPGLPEIVHRNHGAGRLSFTTKVADAVPGADVVFLAVGTPPNAAGEADIGAVLGAARDAAPHLSEGAVVVTKSTVPVGTTERVRQEVSEHATVPFYVASNPEFLKEGDAVADFTKPDRVIVGADDPRAAEVLHALYSSFVEPAERILVMDIRSAELSKYAANAMLATRISFMNELARLAELVGADIDAVRTSLGTDPRIGAAFLRAGPGFGGSCLPKDIRALLATGRKVGQDLLVLGAVEQANLFQRKLLGERVIERFGGDLSGRRVALWGVSFKPDTDDVRESPAVDTAQQLLAAGAEVAVYDPAGMEGGRFHLGDTVTYATDAYSTVDGADVLVLVTEWGVFRDADFDEVKRRMRGNVLFDGRNVWDAAHVKGLGFEYRGIGRP